MARALGNPKLHMKNSGLTPPGRKINPPGGPYDTTRLEIEAKAGSPLSHAEQVGGFFSQSR